MAIQKQYIDWLFFGVLLASIAPSLHAQTSRKITKADENKIKRETRNLIDALDQEYDFFLASTASERDNRLGHLLTPGAQRMFANDKVTIEDDFFDTSVEGLEQRDRDLPVEDYFNRLAAKFGENDQGESVNAGKTVALKITQLSKIQAHSDVDSMYIKATFEILYDGVARNGHPFKNAERVAEMTLEREGKNWRAYIRSLRFHDPAIAIDSKAASVGIVEEVMKMDIKYEDAIASETKIVSRIPSIKAFYSNELWGLFTDENNDKRILAQPVFCEVDEFTEEGRALVCQDGKWGFVDREGKLAIPCRYDLALSFVKGKAQVEFGGRRMTIDVNGKIVK